MQNPIAPMRAADALADEPIVRRFSIGDLTFPRHALMMHFVLIVAAGIRHFKDAGAMVERGRNRGVTKPREPVGGIAQEVGNAELILQHEDARRVRFPAGRAT